VAVQLHNNFGFQLSLCALLRRTVLEFIERASYKIIIIVNVCCTRLYLVVDKFGTGTWYSATYMNQTLDQKRFTILSAVVADD